MTEKFFNQSVIDHVAQILPRDGVPAAAAYLAREADCIVAFRLQQASRQKEEERQATVRAISQARTVLENLSKSFEGSAAP